MNHYGKYLPFAGNPVKYQVADIEMLFMKKERLEKELRELDALISKKEKEFSEFIPDDWTSEEILQAKEKANSNVIKCY